MRESKDPRYLRLRMVRLAQKEGIKPTARLFGTTPKTVRKWVRRYQEQGYQGLKDQSRAPKHPARRVTAAQRRKAVRLKKELPSWGAARIKRDYQLLLSEKALRKIWREEGLLKKKRRKHKTKNDLRHIKQQWRLFEQIGMDTKDLDDIPELWPQIRRLRLPKVQYTAREVVSGLHFVAYAQERSLTYANLFVKLLLGHLKSCG
ncbi:MAG TPA: helix-turn-helix domain-containing protein, partial [Acidobacteriota bacterium]|nr:helix-turn-helix domain-containing protein [Acidobacteriota bacterium]